MSHANQALSTWYPGWMVENEETCIQWQITRIRNFNLSSKKRIVIGSGVTKVKTGEKLATM